MLFFAPHPDDEAWAAGATLADLAAAGAIVQVVFATDGEAGIDRRRESTAVAAGCVADLADTRRAEAVAASAILGAQAPRFLGLPDGDLDRVDGLAAIVHAAIAEHAADVVLSFGRDGGYPHRDHIALAAAVAQAIACPRGDDDSAAAPTLLCAVFGRGVFAPLLAKMRKGRGAALLATHLADDRLGEPLRGPAARRHLSVVVEPWRAAKNAAIAAHRSQLVGGETLTLLGPSVMNALFDAERWRAATTSPTAINYTKRR